MSVKMAAAHKILINICEKYASDEDIKDWLDIGLGFQTHKDYLLEGAVKDACSDLGLKYDDLIELKIAVASLAAISEVAEEGQEGIKRKYYQATKC